MGNPGRSGDSRHELFLAHLPVTERIVDFVCRRNFLQHTDAEDFRSHVHMTLLADDCTVLRQFSGRSSIQTYLSIVIHRILLDYRRAAWGKWRPSAAASRLGPIAVLAEQLTVRDGCGAEEAYQIVVTNHDVAISRAAFEELLAQLPRRYPRRVETDAALEELPASVARPDEELLQREAAELGTIAERALRRAIATLDAGDQLVLAMRFNDGRTVAEIASALRLDQRPHYRRMERLLRELRQKLEAEGVDESFVHQMLGEDQPAHSPEKRSARPSVVGDAR